MPRLVRHQRARGVDKLDPHELRDSLVADLVATSLENTGVPNDQDAVDFIVPILEKMDNKPKAKAPTPTINANAQEQLQAEAKRQGIEGNVERFVPDAILTPERVEDDTWRLAAKRLKWMRAQPKYKRRVNAIASMMMLGKNAVAEHKLKELFRESDEQLKRPWWKPEAKALWFG